VAIVEKRKDPQMKKDTFKIFVAIVRAFADYLNKGNDATLRADEIHNFVCRHLRYAKTKDKKMVRGIVMQGLNTLRAKKILYAEVELPENDVLSRPKSVEARTIYGLTHDAFAYLTVGLKLPKYSVTGEQTITNLLNRFGIFPDAQQVDTRIIPAVPAPAAAVIPPPVVVEDTPPVTPSTEAELEPNRFSNNVQRVAAEVRNIRWRNTHTPAALLGALRAARAFSNDARVYSPGINWDGHKATEAAEQLHARGLLEWAVIAAVKSDYRNTTHKRHGMYLTELGRQVADAGDFVDNRPPEPHRVKEQKMGDMLKGAKKAAAVPQHAAPAAAVEANVTADNPYAVTLRDGSVVRCATPAAALELARQVAAMADPAATPAPETSATPVAVAEPVRIMLSEDQTIARVVAPTSTELFARVKALADAQLPTGETAETVNALALYHALTQLAYVIAGLKYVVSQRLDDNAEFDVSNFDDYVAQLQLDMEQLERGQARQLTVYAPVVAKLEKTRKLTRKIHRKPWET
jgi:hypothetical protein